MTLDITLGTKQSVRDKYDNTCIAINLICNINGYYKPKPWFMKKAILFCCFSRSSVNLNNFQIV